MSPTSILNWLSLIDKSRSEQVDGTLRDVTNVVKFKFYFQRFVSMHNHQEIIANGPFQNVEKVRTTIYKLDSSSFFKMHLVIFLWLKKSNEIFLCTSFAIRTKIECFGLEDSAVGTSWLVVNLVERATG